MNKNTFIKPTIAMSDTAAALFGTEPRRYIQLLHQVTTSPPQYHQWTIPCRTQNCTALAQIMDQV
jgi:hypothetical protein